MFRGSDKQDVSRGAIESRDPFAAAPPGISLTTDNQNWPWGNPPEEVDVDIILENATAKIDEDEIFREEMFKLLVAGISVEHMVEAWLMNGFETGKFSLDAGLLAKGPLAVYIAYTAEQNNVPYRMFEQEDPTAESRMDNIEYLRLLKANNPKMFSAMREELNKTIRDGDAKIEAAIAQPSAPAPAPEGFMNEEAETDE
jgi:hypothetical protein